MKTPDTEWEKEFDELTGGWDDEYSIMKNELKKLITDLLASRDTYWKEKVRKEVEKTRAWAEVSYKRGYEDGKNNQLQDT